MATKRKKVYLVTLNWKGEIHKFYSTTSAPDVAKRNALRKLSRLLDRSFHTLALYFNGSKDNFFVEESQKEERSKK